MSWVPKHWRVAGILPGSLMTYGAATMYAGIPGSSRTNKGHWTLPGVGQFMLVVEGPVILATVSCHSLMEKGADLDMAMDWLMDTASAIRKRCDGCQEYLGNAWPLSPAMCVVNKLCSGMRHWCVVFAHL